MAAATVFQSTFRQMICDYAVPGKKTQATITAEAVMTSRRRAMTKSITG